MGLIRRHYRPVVAALLGVSALSTPVALTALGGAPASASTYDTITYVQTAGAKGTYLQYKSADGSTTVNQSITSGGGGCSSPTVKSSTPLLTFGANAYPNGYDNAPAAPGTASVGAYQQRTGVCYIPQAWSIENTEGLDFTVGDYPTLVAGRLFVRAQLNIARQDKSSAPSVTVGLVEWRAGTEVASQSCVINGPQGTTIVADTDTAAVTTCTGTDPLTVGFDTIEVQEQTPGGSVSVVGPTSSFSLANQICGGSQIQTASTDGTITTGQVTATLTMTGTSSQCKSYTNFSALANDPQTLTVGDSQVNTTKSLTFDAFSSSSGTAVPFTVVVDWGLFPDCTPETCPATYISFDGTTYSSETYCSAPSAANPLCVITKSYTYTNIGGTDYTDIQETWKGLKDWVFRP